MSATQYFYLDASALAKRYTFEMGSTVLNYLFARLTPDRMIALSVGIAEVVSVLARKRNAKSIDLTLSPKPSSTSAARS